MVKDQEDFIPVLKYRWLTALYDSLLRLTIPEFKFKCRLIKQARIEAQHRVLDLGCGTATLTLLLKKTHPDAEVYGLDADARVLELARAKIAQSGLEITLDQGMSFELPYPDNSFDRVLSSLLLHHLDRRKKRRTLDEAFRILRPGGELHVADWGKPQNIFMRIGHLFVQLLDGFQTTQDNVKGLLPHFFRKSGFADVEQQSSFMTVFGTITLYKARRPE